MKAAPLSALARARVEGAPLPAGPMPDEAVEGEKREVGRDIRDNRGLTRERKKIDRNPRVKNKEKFRRAVIRRKGQVRDVRSQDGGYGGETSGIKKNVSHSVRFK